jgi:hypothetical protein
LHVESGTECCPEVFASAEEASLGVAQWGDPPSLAREPTMSATDSTFTGSIPALYDRRPGVVENRMRALVTARRT